ncbi:uroporphyrinogen decarboxylase family protein [Atribacter laminatus]|uniref:Uroporphyrinogen decarboxylase n=1 Tax=Atribacter laminatus TaxID=2847778 RepID=A0A7T1AK49_ATRLM|nr:uroporphyrinogen decarboxylase family protein [Atribacter laminatus]QPM67404.1 Uroporphyrinogen decarboxylase [Atribacter laminatus]
MVTREERVLRTIRHDSIDYLPSNIYFASHEKKLSLMETFQFPSLDEFDDFLENHLYLTSPMDDTFRFRGDHEFLKNAEKTVFAKVDWGNGILYDRWGIGYDINTDGICIRHHPLRGKSNLEIENYQAPNLNEPGNLALIEQDIKKYSGDYLVVLVGYFGIFERAWGLLGYEEFMMNMLLEPKLMEGFLDKITQYKIDYAKLTVKLGCKIGHTGDDFGSQKGLMFSKDLWVKFFKPRLAQVWKVYKDAGLPVMHHTCGNVTEIIGDMIDIGLDVLEPVQKVMDFSYLKKEFGKYLTFWGGIGTQDILPFGSPQDVKKMAGKVIETLGKGGGMIIAPDQEIMADVPPENVVALVETIKEKRVSVL